MSIRDPDKMAKAVQMVADGVPERRVAEILELSDGALSAAVRRANIVPSAAPVIVSHLVMRGSRTVEEVASAAGVTRVQAALALKWLTRHRFLETANPHGKGGETAKVLYSIRVYPGGAT